MKKTSLFLILTLSTVIAFTQTKPKKIKIILMGTFHLNQSLESASRLHSNLFSEQRQKEVANIVSQLAGQKPDKIFMEFTQTNQKYYDSIYNEYLAGKEPQSLKVKANEIFQFGMKTAKQLGHKKVYGMNYQPQELGDSTYKPLNVADKALQQLYNALGAFEDSLRSNTSFYDLPYPYRQVKQDSLLQKSTLASFILQMNQPMRHQYEEYNNWTFFYSIGKDNMNYTDYVGTFWYGANVRNFNNVLREVDYKKDNCYLVIYGNSHIPFLSYLFKMHPYFEVVDLSTVLK
jgi:hypothetical protein